MTCKTKDQLDRDFIEVRNQRTYLIMHSLPVPPELQGREDLALGRIMDHQIEHPDCTDF